MSFRALNKLQTAQQSQSIPRANRKSYEAFSTVSVEGDSQIETDGAEVGKKERKSFRFFVWQQAKHTQKTKMRSFIYGAHSMMKKKRGVKVFSICS